MSGIDLDQVKFEPHCLLHVFCPGLLYLSHLPNGPEKSQKNLCVGYDLRIGRESQHSWALSIPGEMRFVLQNMSLSDTSACLGRLYLPSLARCEEQPPSVASVNAREIISGPLLELAQ